MEEVVIVSAARTPVGSFNGAFANVPAHDLGKAAIADALKRADVRRKDVSEVIMGQILTAAQGQNPGASGLHQCRHSGGDAGLDREPALRFGPSRRGAGLSGDFERRCEHRRGGRTGIHEPWRRTPPICAPAHKMGDLSFIDTMIKDGLWDAFNGYHMGVTAENVAREWQITREQQDKFAVASQNKAEAARKSGRFKDEIAPVTIKERKGDRVVDTDEFIRDGVTYEGISGLKPAFQKDGTVTAANASGINDGAAALVLMSAKEAKARGLKPLARIKSWAQRGVDPKVMGSGPIPASRAALKKAGWEAIRSRSRRSQ